MSNQSTHQHVCLVRVQFLSLLLTSYSFHICFLSLLFNHRSVEISKEELRNLQRIEQQEEEKYLQSKSAIASLLETSVILSEAKKLEDEEIVRLERALQMAREKNVNTVMKLATVDVALSNENKASEVLQLESCCDGMM